MRAKGYVVGDETKVETLMDPLVLSWMREQNAEMGYSSLFMIFKDRVALNGQVVTVAVIPEELSALAKSYENKLAPCEVRTDKQGNVVVQNFIPTLSLV